MKNFEKDHLTNSFVQDIPSSVDSYSSYSFDQKTPCLTQSKFYNRTLTLSWAI